MKRLSLITPPQQDPRKHLVLDADDHPDEVIKQVIATPTTVVKNFNENFLKQSKKLRNNISVIEEVKTKVLVKEKKVEIKTVAQVHKHEPEIEHNKSVPKLEIVEDKKTDQHSKKENDKVKKEILKTENNTKTREVEKPVDELGETRGHDRVNDKEPCEMENNINSRNENNSEDISISEKDLSSRVRSKSEKNLSSIIKNLTSRARKHERKKIVDEVVIETDPESDIDFENEDEVSYESSDELNMELHSHTPRSFRSKSSDYAGHINFIKRQSVCSHHGKCQSTTRRNMSFSNPRLREIERENDILLKKILNPKPTYANPFKKPIVSFKLYIIKFVSINFLLA